MANWFLKSRELSECRRYRLTFRQDSLREIQFISDTVSELIFGVATVFGYGTLNRLKV